MKIPTSYRHPQSLVLLAYILITCVTCKQMSKVDTLGTDSDNIPFANYNHTALVVKNLDASIAFYNYVFEFDTIPYPFPHRENIGPNGCLPVMVGNYI